MPGIANDLRQKLINLFLRNTSYTPPATVYVALYLSDPTNADTGTEVAGGAYARQAVTFGAPTAAGATDNTGLLTFPVATVDWGVVTHIGIRDAVTGGNLIMYGPLNSSRNVKTGDTFRIPVGDLDVTLSGGLGNYARQAALNHALRNVAYTPAATVYAALYTVDPTNADTGTEVAGGAYARQAVTFGAPTSAGATDNTGTLTYPTATANWGTVLSAAVRDALTAGNLLWSGALSSARTVLSTDVAKFNLGDLDVTLA